MRPRLHLTALAWLLLVALQTPRAESRSSALLVRVNVVRACSVDARGAGDEGTVALTCSRGTATGMVVTGSGTTSRVVPVPARQTTVVSTPADFAAVQGSATAPRRASAATRQVVTVNF